MNIFCVETMTAAGIYTVKHRYTCALDAEIHAETLFRASTYILWVRVVKNGALVIFLRSRE